jgi:hypothetical protein
MPEDQRANLFLIKCKNMETKFKKKNILMGSEWLL